jgi:hypothetical protein
MTADQAYDMGMQTTHHEVDPATLTVYHDFYIQHFPCWEEQTWLLAKKKKQTWLLGK